MELWIRSQSRHNLMKANDIVAQDNKILVYKESEQSTIVGKYVTKERTLEVLDEIQCKLDYIYELSLRPRALTTIEHKIVYEMPEK